LMRSDETECTETVGFSGLVIPAAPKSYGLGRIPDFEL